MELQTILQELSDNPVEPTDAPDAPGRSTEYGRIGRTCKAMCLPIY